MKGLCASYFWGGVHFLVALLKWVIMICCNKFLTPNGLTQWNVYQAHTRAKVDIPGQWAVYLLTLYWEPRIFCLVVHIHLEFKGMESHRSFLSLQPEPQSKGAIQSQSHIKCKRSSNVTVCSCASGADQSFGVHKAPAAILWSERYQPKLVFQ